MNNRKDVKRPKRISNLFKNISKKYGNIQKKCTDKAQEFGYSKDIFEKTGSKYQDIPDTPTLEDVEKTLKDHSKFVGEQEKNVTNFFGQMNASYIAYATVTSTSSATASTYPYFLTKPEERPPSWTPDRHKRYTEKLIKLDKEIAETHSSIWEIFYGTTQSPEKSALAAMRQTFDHFFCIIAPDDEVRESLYFKRKKGKKCNQIHRVERLLYVANIKVKDKKIANLLISQSEQILKTYQKLNRMHSRKKLNRNLAQEILNSMQSILEEWIDAIGL